MTKISFRKAKTGKTSGKTNLRIEVLKHVLIPILKEHGVKKAGIFGSVARGEAGKKSDIDILIEFKGRKSLLDVVGLKLDIEERLKRGVDLAEYSAVHPLLKERILNEEVRIYEER